MQKVFILFMLVVSTVFISKAQMPVIGTKATELKYKDPSGNEIALSSLKGKLVLIDFWASWCGPCRRANPIVVALYKEYQNKKWVKGVSGFTIYSVSLDQNEANWKQAIAQDGLIWKNHVSDLKGWSSEGAAKYGVRSIPQTVLVDETGYVIAINPSHELLKSLLDKKVVSSNK